jgi:hypothetical protein
MSLFPPAGRSGTRVDVIVVSYNSREQLRACVLPFMDRGDISVVVVDNASSDGSLESVGGLALTRLPLDRNIGFGGGCNVGWRAGASPYVLFLNPDARLDADGLQHLVDTLEQGGGGIAAPRIHREDGSLDWSLRRFPEVRSIYGQALFAHRFFPSAAWVDEVIRDPDVYAKAHACDWASGACLLVRRDLLEELEGFDEAFFMYCEDVDLCARAWESGHPVLYTPEAVCVHAGGSSKPRTQLLPVLARSRIRYAKKHFTPRHAFAYRLGVGFVALTHVLVSRSWRSRVGYARSLGPVLHAERAS